jgi:hypothetical protein
LPIEYWGLIWKFSSWYFISWFYFRYYSISIYKSIDFKVVNREFTIYDVAGSTTRFQNKEICSHARQKLWIIRGPSGIIFIGVVMLSTTLNWSIAHTGALSTHTCHSWQLWSTHNILVCGNQFRIVCHSCRKIQLSNMFDIFCHAWQLCPVCAEQMRAVQANRQVWTKRWILRRHVQGTFNNLVREINAEDPGKFRQFHRLDRESFEHILGMVSSFISKKETHLWPAIKPCERLSVTLRFLATGLGKTCLWVL